MWVELLRNKQMMGYPFLRQRPIVNYIADFFSKELNLIIEVDGLTHSWEGRAESDIKRDKTLLELGYHTLRFNDGEVINDINNVKKAIENFIIDFEKIISQPPSKGHI
ncbi:endonuclease domain-containing protein [Pedobacter sp. SL55]|uniref:endonuclease domain-containing protein n=1 Tax=Pedobacter sp. SL55 TaxID=2995161 RepID=UPI00226FADC8|nr:endonuclease domain-containing protein [Pedobacter sp. SL55]WAC41252.1 endonuclease domain-containing protein [Pedobacter sp. SL55]